MTQQRHKALRRSRHVAWMHSLPLRGTDGNGVYPDDCSAMSHVAGVAGVVATEMPSAPSATDASGCQLHHCRGDAGRQADKPTNTPSKALPVQIMYGIRKVLPTQSRRLTQAAEALA